MQELKKYYRGPDSRRQYWKKKYQENPEQKKEFKKISIRKIQVQKEYEKKKKKPENLGGEHMWKILNQKEIVKKTHIQRIWKSKYDENSESDGWISPGETLQSRAELVL